jgi:hypothetical protein
MTERAEHPRTAAGADSFAMLADELGQEVQRLATRFKHAGEGDRIVRDARHAKPFDSSGSLVKTSCYQGLRSVVTDDQIANRATGPTAPLPKVTNRCTERLNG